MSDNSQNFDESSGRQKEYETNTTALITITLFTLAVVGVVLAVRGGSMADGDVANQFTASQKQNSQPESGAADNEVSQQDIQPNDQGPVEPRSLDTTDDLPSGLIIDGATVISNKEVTYAGDSQRNIALETNQPPGEVFSYYRTWFQDNGYEILNSSEENGFMLGSNGTADITLSFDRQGDTTQVNMEYIPLSE
jgi:hypothetical protein